MKWLLDIVGGIVALMGVVWILQGTNILRVGFMAGQMQYALLGIVAVIVGIGLIAYANRSRRHTPSASH
jgi:uncharacterized membrane protein HdeD (DUF308 family)